MLLFLILFLMAKYVRSYLMFLPRTSSIPIQSKGRAVSMTRLDQLSQPIRRCGVHIRAIEEREKREQELIEEQHNLSKSLTHLGGSGSGSGFGTPSRPLSRRHHGSTTKSMIQLQNANRYLIANKKLLSRNNFKIEHKVYNLILLVASPTAGVCEHLTILFSYIFFNFQNLIPFKKVLS